MKTTLQRRQLLGLLGSGTALTALHRFVPTLEGDALAQTLPSTRYLFWYTPTMPSSAIVNTLYQSDEGPLNMQGAWKPLNEIADKLLLVRNLNNMAAKENRMEGGHKSSGITQLSGWPIIDVAGTGFTELKDGKGLGHSTLDQWMAEQTGTPIAALTFRYPANGNFYSPNVWRSISSKDGIFVPYLESPRAVFNTLFPLTESGAQSQELAARKKSILDHVYRSVERIESRVSSVDKARIEAHLDSIRAIEKKLEVPLAQCSLDEALSQESGRMDQTQDLYMDLVVAAFSCGLTRVAGGMFHSHINGYDYGFLGHNMGDNYHAITHGDGPRTTAEKEAFLKDVLSFRATQFVKLIKKLQDAPDPEGTSVLANTVVHWTSEVGRDHAWDDLPTFLTSGGYFKTGQMVRAQAKSNGEQAPLNRLHTSIARAMGFSIDHFGDPRYGEGGLLEKAII